MRSHSLALFRTLESVGRYVGETYFAAIYISSIALAEIVTVFIHPVLGITAHATVLGCLLVHAGLTQREREWIFTTALLLAPLIRIVSLATSPDVLSEEYSVAVTLISIAVAIVAVARANGLTRRSVNLNWPKRQYWLPTFVVFYFSLLIGALAYRFSILGLDETGNKTGGQLIAYTFLLVFVTALVEEIVFRGILQTAASFVLGERIGIISITLLYGALHVGHRAEVSIQAALIDVAFMSAFGLYLALTTLWTRSLLGAVLVHTSVVSMMLLILPKFSQ